VGQGLVVVLDRAQQRAHGQVDAAGLLARILAVLQVGLVDDLGEDARRQAQQQEPGLQHMLQTVRYLFHAVKRLAPSSLTG
jgi:hypothetical protein